MKIFLYFFSFGPLGNVVSSSNMSLTTHFPSFPASLSPLRSVNSSSGHLLTSHTHAQASSKRSPPLPSGPKAFTLHQAGPTTTTLPITPVVTTLAALRPLTIVTRAVWRPPPAREACSPAHPPRCRVWCGWRCRPTFLVSYW